MLLAHAGGARTQHRGLVSAAAPIILPGDYSPKDARSTVVFNPQPNKSSYPLPQTFLDSTYSQSGTVSFSTEYDELMVDSGSAFTNRVNLQTAVNDFAISNAHTRIRLPNNWVSGEGILVLKQHSFAGKWTYIEWDIKDTVSAGEGFRCITSLMSEAPVMYGNNFGNGALWCDLSADRYRLTGLRFKRDNYIINYRIVHFSGVLGSDEQVQDTDAKCPSYLTMDRCWIDGENDGRVQNALVINSKYTSVVDSVIDGHFGDGYESHAILSHNSPGPIKIVNNELESSTINFIIGGTFPNIPNMQTYDVEFRKNWCHKRPSWNENDPVNFDGRPEVRMVKNLWELKWGERILCEANIFEYNWSGTQQGAAICLKCENAVFEGAPGGAMWTKTKNITFRDNIIKDSWGIIEFQGRGFGGALDEHMNSIEVYNNLFYEMGADTYALVTDSGVSPRGMPFSQGVFNLHIEHNTMVLTNGAHTRWGIVHQHIKQPGYFQPNLVIKNNIFDIPCIPGGSGTLYSSATQIDPVPLQGQPTLDAFCGVGQWAYDRNILTGAMIDEGFVKTYPANSAYPDSSATIAYIDRPNHNYRLSVASPYKNYGTDSTDPGCDQSSIEAATLNVRTGL